MYSYAPIYHFFCFCDIVVDPMTLIWTWPRYLNFAHISKTKFLGQSFQTQTHTQDTTKFITTIGVDLQKKTRGDLSPPLPLEVGPLNQLKGLGKISVSSPSRVWGRAPAEIELWCIVALKSDIWWQQL